MPEKSLCFPQLELQRLFLLFSRLNPCRVSGEISFLHHPQPHEALRDPLHSEANNTMFTSKVCVARVIDLIKNGSIAQAALPRFRTDTQQATCWESINHESSSYLQVPPRRADKACLGAALLISALRVAFPRVFCFPSSASQHVPVIGLI